MKAPLNVLALAWRVCGLYQGSVTSWIRSAEHNAAVGGVRTSKHVDGLAVDVKYDSAVPPPYAEVQAMAYQFGCKLVREKDHDHFEVI